jgi:hypothetical protein
VQKRLAQDDKQITIAGPNESGIAERNLACPYFMPTEKLSGGSWSHPARLPLGGGWSGYCTAPHHENTVPPQHILEAFCNLGYATGCAWAPHERKWDAVRFAVSAPPDPQTRERKNASRLVHICYVCERDHRPIERGDLEFDTQQLGWTKAHSDPRLQKMAECFLESRCKKND